MKWILARAVSACQAAGAGRYQRQKGLPLTTKTIMSQGAMNDSPIGKNRFQRREFAAAKPVLPRKYDCR
jgi:hypothetical protein